ncbi:MAG: hypothetical protein JO007_10775 [Alphaproteobacteria bacterium]|nr:hypothetical protein [Alphaproteobacteria bacterium]
MLAAFFLLVVVIENILVGIWAYGVSGQPARQGARTYTMAGVYSIAMLVSGAASFIGGTLGFLFGIPQSNMLVARTGTVADKDRVTGTAGNGKGRQVDAEHTAIAEESETAVAAPPAGPGSGLRHNTNLENISDALTKGLLAIGVTQLYRIEGWVRALAPALGESFGPGTDGQIAGFSILTYGAIEGFLFGYLATRTYLTGVFEESDPQT